MKAWTTAPRVVLLVLHSALASCHCGYDLACCAFVESDVGDMVRLANGDTVEFDIQVEVAGPAASEYLWLTFEFQVESQNGLEIASFVECEPPLGGSAMEWRPANAAETSGTLEFDAEFGLPFEGQCTVSLRAEMPQGKPVREMGGEGPQLATVNWSASAAMYIDDGAAADYSLFVLAGSVARN